MRPRDISHAQTLDAALDEFDAQVSLPGIRLPRYRLAFIEQVLESTRRVKYVTIVRQQQLSPLRADPDHPLFDPLKASILHQRAGKRDEAYWMLFYFVHFGKHAKGGWRYAREVYGRLGSGQRWDWNSVRTDPPLFRRWLSAHQSQIIRPGAGFGNHRKYQSIDAYARNGTGDAFQTYVEWVINNGGHQALMDRALAAESANPRRAFHRLYQSMAQVASFGRTARFDYLALIGKVGLSAIEPGATYMNGATGPLRGARLLFGINAGPVALDKLLVRLDSSLGVGMQVLEDSLCNWAKSPSEFKPFRG